MVYHVYTRIPSSGPIPAPVEWIIMIIDSGDDVNRRWPDVPRTWECASMVYSIGAAEFMSSTARVLRATMSPRSSYVALHRNCSSTEHRGAAAACRSKAWRVSHAPFSTVGAQGQSFLALPGHPKYLKLF